MHVLVRMACRLASGMSDVVIIGAAREIVGEGMLHL
jgi:hypothetical protein